jgi:hypothetical protein
MKQTPTHTKADIWCNYLDGARFAKGALEEKLHEYMVTVARISVISQLNGPM